MSGARAAPPNVTRLRSRRSRSSGRQVDKVRLIQEVAVRWHQGQLLFAGTRRNAVFTVVLSPSAG